MNNRLTHPCVTRAPLALYLAALLPLLAGCSALRSDYHRPEVTLPAAWQQGASAPTRQLSEPWWRAFDDPRLNGLIDEVLRQNADLAVAGIKLSKARLQANLTATNQTPDLTVGASQQVSAPLKGGDSTRNYNAQASLSYELDLWGRLASSRDAARWEAEATAQDKAATALSLVGTTAALYWQIGYLNESLALGEANLADTRHALALATLKHQAGATDGLDLLQAQQDLATQEASLTQTRQQLIEQRNALALLFDAPPEQWQAHELASLNDRVLPRVPAGLPAGLLARRPDLQASEMRLRSALASGDNTRLSLYPVLALTGSAGGESSSLSQVLQDPVGTLGAGLTLPFVNWNQQQLNVQLADTEYAQAVVEFRQSLYQAFSEVENKLAASRHYQQQADKLQAAFELAQRSEQLAEVRYRQGATGVQAWLDEQQKRRTAEQALAENRLNQLNNRMQLFQALGGGSSR
ncbi:MAG: efflux transporter outer membrane subunit [Aeromonadaceae bacterium]